MASIPARPPPKGGSPAPGQPSAPVQPWLYAYAQEAAAGGGVDIVVPASEVWEVTAVSLIDSTFASLDEVSIIGITPVYFENARDVTPDAANGDGLILARAFSYYNGAGVTPTHAITWSGRMFVTGGETFHGFGGGEKANLVVKYRRVVLGDPLI